MGNRTSEWWLRVVEVVFAGAIVFFAFVQWRVSVHQWEMMRDSNELTRDSIELQGSAWLAFHSIEPVKRLGAKPPEVEPDMHYPVKAVMKNSGPGPALDVDLFACSMIGNREPPEFPDLSKCRLEHPGNTILSIGATTRATLNLGPYSQEQLTDIGSGKLVLSVVLGATYKDIFGRTYTSISCNVLRPTVLRNFAQWDTCSIGEKVDHQPARHRRELGAPDSNSEDEARS